ncbi:MAG: DUF6587 family protein [Oceanococcus sp.]
MISVSAQWAVLSVILFWAAWYVFGYAAPLRRAAVQQSWALWLMAPERPRLCNRFGMALLPRVDQHCGGGCSDCGTCSS